MRLIDGPKLLALSLVMISNCETFYIHPAQAPSMASGRVTTLDGDVEQVPEDFEATLEPVEDGVLAIEHGHRGCRRVTWVPLAHLDQAKREGWSLETVHFDQRDAVTNKPRLLRIFDVDGNCVLVPPSAIHRIEVVDEEKKANAIVVSSVLVGGGVLVGLAVAITRLAASQGVR